MRPTKKSVTAIPLVEERLTVDKHAVETGRVRIRTVVDEQLARVTQDLERDDVSIERVPINQEVTAMPQVREEGDVLVVPLLEEVIFVEKRLVLREELRIHRNRKQESVDEAVRVRRMRAEVERVPVASEDHRTASPRIRRKAALRETVASDRAELRRSRSRPPHR